MTSHDKAIVRSFLATESAKAWLEEIKSKCPTLDIGKVASLDLYNASLIREKGWREAIDFAGAYVKEDAAQTDFGLQSIDTVRN